MTYRNSLKTFQTEFKNYPGEILLVSYKNKVLNVILQVLRTVTVGSLLLYGLISCQSVKPYQKVHLNDAEMKLSARKIQKVEQNFQLYREGASGANGGKSGGGCGCN